MKKLLLFMCCLTLTFMLYGCNNVESVNEEIAEDEIIEEEMEEEIQEETTTELDFNQFATKYVTYTDTLNSYMQVLINTYTNDSIVDSYNNVKEITEKTASMDVKALKNEDYQGAVDYLESYKLIVNRLSSLILKSYDKTLKTNELSEIQSLSEQAITYSETCNKFANVFEKYNQ